MRRATEPFQSDRLRASALSDNQFRISPSNFVIRDTGKKAWHIYLRGGSYQFDHSNGYWGEYWP
jgi:hypothetical protein